MEQNNYAVGEQRERDTKGWSDSEANKIAFFPAHPPFYIITTLMVYYNVSGLFFSCPCMASNVSVQYNGGLLPDIILSTQCYYRRGTRLNAMKRFCIFSY